MADITIYLGNKNYSSWSLRPWLALKQTGAAFEEVVIPLHDKAALRRESPSARVPALRHDGLLVWESLAICEYLAEAFPKASLWPQDRQARAHGRAISNEMHAGFSTLRKQLPMNFRYRRLAVPARVAAAQSDIERMTAIWREARQRYGEAGANGAGPYLFGGFSVADAMFAPVCSRFSSYRVTLDPVSAKYVEAVCNAPAMQEWAAAAVRESWIYPEDEVAEAAGAA